MKDLRMTHRFARNLFGAAMMMMTAASPYAQGQTVYEPSANDPRIKAVLDARERFARGREAGRLDDG